MQANPQPVQPRRFIRERERAQITGIGRIPWYELELKGTAPKRIKLSERSVAWLLSDIEAWMDQKIRESLGGQPD